MAKPEIRLQGFEGEWKECPFHVVAKPYFISNKYVHHQNLLSLSYGKIKRKDINSGKGLLPASFDTYQIIKDGIIVFRFTDLQNDKKSLRVGLAKEEGIISPAYVCVECENISPEFLFLQLYSYDLRKVFYSMGDGLRQTLSYNDVKDMPIYVPSDKEQKFIIDYFNSIESEILSEESKLASLKQMKQACLVSMFPQAGETTPRVRFKGFEGEWECEPLCNFSKKVIKKNQNLEYKITLTNSAEYGIINQLDFFDHDVSNGDNIGGYYIVENDDFVYNPRISATAPVGPINRNQLGYAGVMSPLYYVFRVHGIDKDYMSVFFKTTLWHKFMKDNGNSGARFDRLSITDDVFIQMPILYPKDIKEQQRIASYFRSLDKQISLQEKRLEKLKQIKAACLDKMFV
jgi:type I restriction enzyme S subunit